MMKKRKRMDRLARETKYNIEKLGMSNWEAHKTAWRKLHPITP